jgi:S-adenosylmethionine synthetase
MRRYIFSSESVTEGHPDKVCDTISDYILDACLEQDPLSRVACETLAKGNLVVLAGEITSNARNSSRFSEQVREAVRSIGYINADCIFHADTCRVLCEMTEQSRDIKQGVDEVAAEGKGTTEQGAGDQGLMFGFRLQRNARNSCRPRFLSRINSVGS